MTPIRHVLALEKKKKKNYIYALYVSATINV